MLEELVWSKYKVAKVAAAAAAAVVIAAEKKLVNTHLIAAAGWR